MTSPNLHLDINVRQEELIKMLEDAGFQLLRKGTKHDIYTLGELTTYVPHGMRQNPRRMSYTKALIRRAQRMGLTKSGVAK